MPLSNKEISYQYNFKKPVKNISYFQRDLFYKSDSLKQAQKFAAKYCFVYTIFKQIEQSHTVSFK